MGRQAGVRVTPQDRESLLALGGMAFDGFTDVNRQRPSAPPEAAMAIVVLSVLDTAFAHPEWGQALLRLLPKSELAQAGHESIMRAIPMEAVS